MNAWREKVAVITGASSGLGYAIASALSKYGAQVVLVARNAERLQTAFDSLAMAPPNAIAVAADITRQTDVDAVFSRTMEAYGRVDLLVNCAGRSSRASVLDTTPEEFSKLFELNLVGTVRCTQAATGQLLKSGGDIINIGSLASKIATPYHGAYPASKFALAAYSQQLRLLLKPRGVGVLLVCPGPIASAVQRSTRDPAYADVPLEARGPGAGAKIRAIDPDLLATSVLRACEKRKDELVIPAKARFLSAIAALSPSWGDWILRRYSSQ